MKHKTTAAWLALGLALCGTAAVADVSCDAPKQEGNTWLVTCSGDGNGESDYQCDYQLSVTNADGQSDVVTASGTVGQAQQGIILWSGIQNMGSDIVSVTVSEGSCQER